MSNNSIAHGNAERYNMKVGREFELLSIKEVNLRRGILREREW
jgi:hypothetical protein